MALSWDEVCKRAKENGKTVLCKVEKQNGRRHNFYLLKCDECGTEKKQSSDHFDGCLTCKKVKFSIGLEEFLRRAFDKHGDRFDYSLVKLVSIQSKVKIICKNCGKVFEQSPACHLDSYGCICYKRIFYKEKFLVSCRSLHGDRYNYDFVDYHGMKTNIKILCNQCNNFFIQRPSSHLSDKKGCPVCNESKGENKVAKYLSENNIKFTKNKIFKTLKDKSYLKPDFYLSGLNLLIEYDGEGHYNPCFGSSLEEKQKNLRDCQRRDKIKDEWAKANNIPLLRIPYWDFDRIEELVGNFVGEYIVC